MKKLRLLSLFIVLTVLCAPALQAASDVPLMIVRYNQPRVYYDKQLYHAASKAVRIKPTVVFSVVSFIPTYADMQERIDNAARQQQQKLVADLRTMGIPENQITVTEEHVNDAKHHEIYLYVD
jgi:hypothetical protein